MKAPFHSIRWRLLASHAIVLTIVLVAFSTLVNYLARDNRFRGIDQELQQSVATVTDALRPRRPPGGPGRGPGPDRFGRGPRLGFPEERPRPDFDGPDRHPERGGPERGEFGPLDLGGPEPDLDAIYYTVWSPSNVLLRRSSNAPPELPPPGANVTATGDYRTRGHFREFACIRRINLRIVVGKDITADLAELRRLGWALAGSAVAVLILGLISGWSLASRVIRPIAAISATARKIAEGNLDERIDAGETGNELGQLAEVLNDTFGRLQAAFQRQAQFTSDASHELRTPVSVVLSQTQMALHRERTPAEYRDCIGACQRAAQRMRQLIESLLILARLDASNPERRREPCDLAAIAQEVIDLLAPLARDRSVRLSHELSTARCVADPDQIAQAITNLVSNAIHYNRDQGSVHVSVRSDTVHATVEIKDTGIGMSADILPRIFDRFFRADPSRTGSDGRSGLGLAITREIIGAHEGTIHVSSEPGHGSTFRVILPAASLRAEPRLEP